QKSRACTVDWVLSDERVSHSEFRAVLFVQHRGFFRREGFRLVLCCRNFGVVFVRYSNSGKPVREWQRRFPRSFKIAGDGIGQRQRRTGSKLVSRCSGGDFLGSQVRRRKISGFVGLQVRWRFPMELQALFFDCTEKTSGDWRNSGAGFSWSDRNKGRWICKLGKLLGRVHIGINLRGADPRAAVLQYGEKKLQEILDPMLKAAETTGEEDDFGVFSAGCEGRRD
ncbi:hypothetical protein U1Q18_041760, partial [Sarracenia purpurea var. burkii]